MNLIIALFLLLSLSASDVEDSDGVKRVKAKFLVNYKELCIKGGITHKLSMATYEKKCTCQVKQFDQNLNGDEVILLFTSKSQFQYPELKAKANALIKKCN